MRELVRDLTGRFVGCDGHPWRATCSFHDEPGSLAAGDWLQLEVELVMGDWSPLFHRCPAHAVEVFPERHSLVGTEQALVRGRLDPTGAYLPGTNEYAPEALTLSEVSVVDVCGPEEGRCPPCREPATDHDHDAGCEREHERGTEGE
jgi:hypothetical protein